MAKHSHIGASSMHRWAACPKSVQLCAELPPAPSSVYAEEGTLAHDIASERLEKGKYRDDVDPEMLAAVEVYVDHVENLWKNLPQHKASKLMIEHRFDLSTVHPGLFGTADCVIYCGSTKTLYVIDYKHGQGVPVSPHDNEQLKYYGLGALLSMNVPIVKVVLTIVQPRFSDETAIKSAELTPIEMLEFSVDLADFAKETENPNAKLERGDHCRFCPAKIVCPALKEAALVAAKAEFALAELPKLTPEYLSDLLGKIEAVETWVKGVREFAYQEAKCGRTPPGYKLVAKRAIRKWADATAAQKKLEQVIHQSAMRDLMTDPELRSVAQVEKILGKGNKDLIAELSVAVSSGDTLVPDSDARQAVKPLTASEAFAKELLE